jgi:hypothetical protein
MFKPPSVNQITSAYTGRMPQLAQRVEQDKKANGGIPQDLRQLMALNDMTQAGNSAGIQSALNQPVQQDTVADDIRKRAQQVIQTKMAQAAQQQKAMQDSMQQIRPQGIPDGLPSPKEQPKEQGIDQLPTNVGEYAHGGIIGYAGEDGSYVDERDILRRMEAQAYEENNREPKAQVTSADIIMQAMMADPAARRKEAEERRNAIQRDTSSHDRLVAEYQAEKERLNAPKEGYAAFMDYVSKIAQAPRGMGSLSAGAYGAQKVNEEQEARAAKRHDLTKQMLDISQKKADIGYQQKMDVFGAGESAEAAAIKARYDAAINQETSAMKKQELAQQRDLELQKLQQAKELSEADLAVRKQQVAAMNRPETFERIYAQLQKNDPTADKKVLFEKAVSMSGLSARQDSADAALLGKMQQAIKDIEAKPEYKLLAIPGALEPAKEKELREQKKADIKAVTDAYQKFGLGPAQGLPALAGQNAPETGGSYTVSAGGKTYSFPNAEAAAQFKRDAGVK